MGFGFSEEANQNIGWKDMSDYYTFKVFSLSLCPLVARNDLILLGHNLKASQSAYWKLLSIEHTLLESNSLCIYWWSVHFAL